MTFLAEVSDKIPIVSHYWVQGITMILIGYLMSKISKILSLIYSALLLLGLVAFIYEFSSSDPFWEAVLKEKGYGYLLAIWGSMLIPAVTTFALAQKEKERKNRVRVVVYLISSLTVAWALSLVWWHLWMEFGFPSFEPILGNPGGDGEEHYIRVESQMFQVSIVICLGLAIYLLTKTKQNNTLQTTSASARV